MKMLNRVWMVLFIVLMLVSISSIALADDHSVASDDAPVVDIPADGVSDGGSVRVNIITIVIGLLGAFAAGGVVGIAGLAQYTNRVKNDVATVTAIEGLANSYPPQTKDLFEAFFQTIKNIGELGVEAFDNVPIVDKVADGVPVEAVG